jgi:hypothetical protein
MEHLVSFNPELAELLRERPAENLPMVDLNIFFIASHIHLKLKYSV